MNKLLLLCVSTIQKSATSLLFLSKKFLLLFGGKNGNFDDQRYLLFFFKKKEEITFNWGVAPTLTCFKLLSGFFLFNSTPSSHTPQTLTEIPKKQTPSFLFRPEIDLIYVEWKFPLKLRGKKKREEREKFLEYKNEWDISRPWKKFPHLRNTKKNSPPLPVSIK